MEMCEVQGLENSVRQELLLINQGQMFLLFWILIQSLQKNADFLWLLWAKIFDYAAAFIKKMWWNMQGFYAILCGEIVGIC